MGEQASDSCFAGSHEAHQINSRCALELEDHPIHTSALRPFRSIMDLHLRQVRSHNSTMQDELLPLFPLQVVLFPRTSLPLHIFEERYKQMVDEVVRGKAEFGVVLAGEKGIVNTGCTASIEKIIKKYPDGRMDLLTVGRRRFEIILLNDEKPYLRGAVEFFDDEATDPIQPEVRKRVIDSYHDLRGLEDPEAVHEPEL